MGSILSFKVTDVMEEEVFIRYLNWNFQPTCIYVCVCVCLCVVYAVASSSDSEFISSFWLSVLVDFIITEPIFIVRFAENRVYDRWHDVWSATSAVAETMRSQILCLLQLVMVPRQECLSQHVVTHVLAIGTKLWCCSSSWSNTHRWSTLSATTTSSSYFLMHHYHHHQ